MATGRVSTDSVNLRTGADPNGETIGTIVKDGPVSIITEKTVDGTAWLLVSASIGGQTHVGWVPKSSVTPDQAVSGVLDWSKTPQVGAVNFHNRFGGQSWRFDNSGVYLQSDPNTRRHSPGAPITCTKILSIYGDEIFKASMQHGIPPELIVMTIATETGANRKTDFTGPETFRWEAAHTTYSAGPMQTLATTAREVIEKLKLPYDEETVAPAFSAQPAPPTTLPLYDGATNIDIGTGEIVLNNQRHQTGFDPILVAACYNHGSLSPSGANPWGLFTFGDHLNRASEWFGDACILLASLRAGGSLDPQIVISDPLVVTDAADNNEFEIDGLLPGEADEEVAFFSDSGATVTKVAAANGFISVRVRFTAAEVAPVPPAPLPAGEFPPPDETAGYVLCIDRVRTERRQGAAFDRTVGFYQGYFDGKKIPEIFGMAAERQRPGDNGLSGRTQHRCISAGTYQLSTQAGASGKFRTIGFSTGDSVGSMPYPAMRVENTGQREGILIHCAKGYLWSTGCINLASQLNNADDNINFGDSRARVIALIESIRSNLGSTFPRANNQEIPGVRLVIRDHN